MREAEAERKKNAEKIDELTKLNDNLEGEKEMLKEKVGNTINDVLKNRVQLDNLMEKLNQVNDYLDKQTLERIQYQMENRRLMEDIGLCRANHDSDKNYLEKYAHHSLIVEFKISFIITLTLTFTSKALTRQRMNTSI